MVKRQWVIGLGRVALIVATTVLSGLADEGQARMMCGQMHGGHGQGEQDEHSAHYLKHLLKHAKEIGLTSEQIGKLNAMQLDLGRTKARAEADIKIAHLDLHALVEDGQADFAAIQNEGKPTQESRRRAPARGNQGQARCDGDVDNGPVGKRPCAR